MSLDVYMNTHVRLEAFGLLDLRETYPRLKVSKIVITNDVLIQRPLEGYGTPYMFMRQGLNVF